MIVTIRASSLNGLFDCPKRWAAFYLEGKTLPSTRPAHIGTCLHASTGAYDQGAHCQGERFSVDESAGLFVYKLYHPDEDVDWLGESKSKAEKIGLALHTRYCTEFSPYQSYDAVEMPLESMDIEIGDITIRLTGTLDRIRQQDGHKGVTDLKSGERAVDNHYQAKTQGHGIQLGVYELLAEYTLHEPMDLPAQIIGLQTTTQYRLGTGEIPRPRDVLLGTQDDKGLLHYAADMIQRGNFYGNTKSMMCNEKYCPLFNHCKFRI